MCTGYLEKGEEWNLFQPRATAEQVVYCTNFEELYLVKATELEALQLFSCKKMKF